MNRIGIRFMAALALLSVIGTASAQVKINPVPSPAGMVNPYGGIWPANDSFYPFQPTVVTGTSTGATATSTGSAVATRGGSAVGINIPTSVTTSATKAAIASGAAKAWRGARALAGPVGAAYTAWTIYDAYKDSGAYVCPPPDFFCFPPTNEADPNQLGWSWTYSETGATYTNVTINGAQSTMLAELAKSFPHPTYTWTAQPVTAPYDGGYRVQISAKRTDGVIRTYVVTKTGAPATINQKQGAPMSDADLEAKAQADMNADPTGSARAKKYLDGIADANAKAAASGRPVPVFPEDIFPKTAPTTVSGNPVTMPDAVVSTTTFPDANGVQQTKTLVEKVTIQPTKQDGTGGATTVVKYITTTTTTTTTTTNNADGTAGAPKVETETKVDSPTPPEFPKDYNKEATQQRVLDELRADAAPAMADQAARVTTEVDAEKAKLAAQHEQIKTGLDSDKGLFYRFLWTPPVGTCQPSTGTVHGFAVSFDICDTVNNIRDVLGWLYAMFTAFTIYGLLFKGTD